MKLPRNATIAHEKMVNYLLQWRPENDKSRFLGNAGYTEKDGEQLARDIRDQLLCLEAEFEETTGYGDMYSIGGSLIGPNGRAIRVMTIWMVESATNKTRFITLYPKKED